MDVKADQLPDGSVCFEVADAPDEWAVAQDCWVPPFAHVWDLVASGTVGEDGGGPILASLFITSTDARVEGVEQLGDAVAWRQFGPAVVVLTGLTPSGGAPIGIEYSRAGVLANCSVGPPEVMCAPG